MIFWLCGRWTGDIWEFQGIFISERKAVEACMDDTFFIFSIELNKQLPRESMLPVDCYYPLREKPKPRFPLNVITRQLDNGPFCPKCNSSLHTRFWGFFRTKNCINPKCENYFILKELEEQLELFSGRIQPPQPWPRALPPPPPPPKRS